MADQLQVTFDSFVAALQAHLEAARRAADPDSDPQVAKASQALESAFSAYDEALYSQLGCDLPLDVFEYEDIDSDTLFERINQVLDDEESDDFDSDFDDEEYDYEDDDSDKQLDEAEAALLDDDYDFDEDDEDEENED